MDGQDGKVPAPRRASLPRLSRPSGPTAIPFAVPGEQPPRVADLSALLGDIDALRLTLQTDLSLAAAALEADAPDLAGELVEGDLAEVRGFGARSAARLRALDAEDVSTATADEADEVDEAAVTPLPRRRILSAGPLMAAAAALIGFVAFVPDRGVQQSPETTMTSAALAGYELSRLVQSGASDEALRLAAEELNDELAALIQQAAHDPAAAQQALMLLDTTAQVLAGQGDSGVLRGVMAETQLLRARLREALPVVAQRPLRSTREATRRAAAPVTVPLVQQQPEKSREAAPSETPKASASPKPSPKPSPSSAPPPPSPQPSSSSSSEPAGTPDGPLPRPDDLPGW